MNILSTLRRMIAAMVALSMFSLTLHSTAVQAAMVSTDSLLVEQQAGYDRARILDLLGQEQARDALRGLGVSAEDVERRVQNMTPQELAQFNDQIDQLPAGGASIFGVVIFVLLLLIVLDLLGATDVFPAIRPVQVN